MENQVLSFEEIKRLFPDEWVLLGNPIYTDDDLGVISAIVIIHDKNKHELVKKRVNWREKYHSATTIFTGSFPQKRYLL
jgi:hypothetical protein